MAPSNNGCTRTQGCSVEQPLLRKVLCVNAMECRVECGCTMVQPYVRT